MDTINLVFKLVNNLKYYLEIDDVWYSPKITNQNIASFKIIIIIIIIIIVYFRLEVQIKT